MRWFKHLTDSRNDEDIAEMIEFNGIESYGIWFIIQEIIASQMDKTDKCSVRYSVKKWAKSCHVSAKKFMKTARFLSEIGKISVDLSDKNIDFLEIECRSLLNLRDEYSKKSRQSQEKVQTKSRQSQEQDTEADTEADTDNIIVEKEFEKWWQKYPERNGRRIGKKDAKLKFKKISMKNWNDLNIATNNYSDYLEKSGLSSMDPHRFLNEKWKDYIESADHGSGSKKSGNKNPEIF